MSGEFERAGSDLDFRMTVRRERDERAREMVRRKLRSLIDAGTIEVEATAPVSHLDDPKGVAVGVWVYIMEEDE